IEIDPYYLREQEQELRTLFPHLKEVILRPAFQVAQSHGDSALLEALGTACADYFLQIVGHNATLDVHFVNPSSVFLLDKGSNGRACSRDVNASFSPFPSGALPCLCLLRVQ